MSTLRNRAIGALILPLAAATLAAQQAAPTTPRAALKDTIPFVDTLVRKAAPTMPVGAGTVNFPLYAAIQYTRDRSLRGLNTFETSKKDTVKFNGLQLRIGTAFLQDFQGLAHENTAAPKLVSGVDQNRLVAIGKGFNNADANMYLDIQLADGIRVAMTSYLSARHHNETWVKDGYIQIDKSPIKIEPLEHLMKYVTLKVGHFEINYGDQHFRRSDNGMALYNPFVGNFIMDAQTTEIGSEVYFKQPTWFAVGGILAGESKGMVQNPVMRGPAWLAKLGYDSEVLPDVRFRLTGSLYRTKSTTSETLFSGDRGGSRYYSVLEPVGSSETTNAWSGQIQPGLKNEILSWVINPFVKAGGLELFGNYEKARGKAASEATRREFRQYVGEAVYRFAGEQLWIGTRYNRVEGTFLGQTVETTTNRASFSGGWFITPNLMSKVELVQQKYLDFIPSDIRNGGKFNGFMISGAVAF